MRIGLDVAQTCAERAGCAWVADALAKALVRSCPDDRFFLYHHFGAWLNHSTKQGTDLRGANVTSPLREFSRWQAHRLWSNVQKGTRSLPGQPEIVHAHSYQAPRVDPARLVFTVHDLSFWICPEYTTEPIRLMCQEGVLQALSRAAAFVFVSGSAKGDFERVLPGFVDRTNPLMHVVRLGSRYSPLAGRIQKESAAPWCFVGSVEPRKNLDALLEAMPLYWSGSRRRRKLVLAGGRGWNSQGLWKKISGLQNAGLVEHLGYVSDESLQALYQKSFALVFPSFYEGFGLPLVEAMSQSCPLI